MEGRTDDIIYMLSFQKKLTLFPHELLRWEQNQYSFSTELGFCKEKNQTLVIPQVYNLKKRA
jgi:hypothetical protein